MKRSPAMQVPAALSLFITLLVAAVPATSQQLGAPALDTLAGNHATIESPRAYVPNCSPSRAQILSGQTMRPVPVTPAVRATPSAPPRVVAKPATVAAPAPAPRTRAVSLPGFGVPANLQGNNYCGQYAMTSVLNSMGATVGFPEVYRETNPAGIFSAPTTLVEYLNKQGARSALANHASAADLRRTLDQGKPVIVLVDCNGTPHWVVISGYKTDTAGNVVSWELRDSVWGVSGADGKHHMAHDEFLGRWQTPLAGMTAGSLGNFHNLMIEVQGYSPQQASTTPLYPGTFGTAFEDNVAGGINDVVTGWKHGAPTDVVSGGGRLVSAVPAAILSVPGRAASNGGRSLMNDAEDRIKRGGLANTAVGATEWAAGGVVRVGGNVLDFGGNTISSAGTMAGNSLKKARDAAGRLYDSIFSR